MVMVLLGVLALWWYRTQVSTSAEVDRLEAGGSGGQSVLESTVMFAIPVLLGFGMLWLIFVLARKD